MAEGRENRIFGGEEEGKRLPHCAASRFVMFTAMPFYSVFFLRQWSMCLRSGSWMDVNYFDLYFQRSPTITLLSVYKICKQLRGLFVCLKLFYPIPKGSPD